MSKNEVMALEMLECLVELSEESFVKVVKCIERMDKTKKTKVFGDILVKVSSKCRKKKDNSHSTQSIRIVFKQESIL